jgi:hypothetical protein
MSSQENSLDRARVASPCPANWENMTGDDRVRFCQECQLQVYNISEMTRGQAEALIAQAEGRICARLYRRADGTILTKDCPVGLRAFKRRIGRIAGAAFTTLLSLGASALGQSFTRTSRDESGNNQLTITRSFFGLNPQEGRATCWGIVSDLNKAVIPGAKVTIVNEKTKYKRVIKSDDEGQFKFGLLEPGVYTLRIEFPGFQDFVREHFRLHSNEEMRLDVLLDPEGLMGVIACQEPPGKGIVIEGVRVRINED